MKYLTMTKMINLIKILYLLKIIHKSLHQPESNQTKILKNMINMKKEKVAGIMNSQVKVLKMKVNKMK